MGTRIVISRIDNFSRFSNPAKKLVLHTFCRNIKMMNKDSAIVHLIPIVNFEMGRLYKEFHETDLINVDLDLKVIEELMEDKIISKIIKENIHNNYCPTEEEIKEIANFYIKIVDTDDWFYSKRRKLYTYDWFYSEVKCRYSLFELVESNDEEFKNKYSNRFLYFIRRKIDEEGNFIVNIFDLNRKTIWKTSKVKLFRDTIMKLEIETVDGTFYKFNHIDFFRE